MSIACWCVPYAASAIKYVSQALYILWPLLASLRLRFGKDLIHRPVNLIYVYNLIETGRKWQLHALFFPLDILLRNIYLCSIFIYCGDQNKTKQISYGI